MFNQMFQDPVADMSTAVARAEAGAAFFDVVFGDEWHRLVDREQVNTSNPLRCMFGELMRGITWREYQQVAWMPIRQSVALGFSCGLWDFLCFLPLPWVSRSFHRLDEAWRLVLDQRFANDALPKPQPAQNDRSPHGRDDSGKDQFCCVN